MISKDNQGRTEDVEMPEIEEAYEAWADLGLLFGAAVIAGVILCVVEAFRFPAKAWRAIQSLTKPRKT